MTEVLFRGKRIDNQEWVYGFYFCMHHNDGRNHIHHFIIPLDAPLPKDKPIGEIQVEVAGTTVSQFTGVVDKHNKKIFENDIVSCTEPYGVYSSEIKGKVVYKISSFVMEYRKFNIPLRNDIPKPEFCVIGNIYDNKDLIGESA